ncbi:peptidoglycan-binding protein LysM [Antarcticibacterium flavum]|uniref:Potassium binding protein Kbp n=1 Tax=Antarcticibacterium flavum TaxID=2058175 RepID=A0A5B7X492_9FLAO|nr:MULTISPECIES: peptidoglycan-binding protein LysM [Antarcticibacterium]MCM4159117.1 peptidoglycan-binding protein LysM [Antarcticibacterium sp. W02-3]QCY69518.1 peptidoglycan-binding protein LysM [Antarcticibacterium flavum]
MGLFKFIKNAGAKVFGPNKETRKETARVEGEINEQERQEDQKAARKLEETIRDLSLQVDGLKIDIEGDTATVKGKAKDQSTREKVVLVVGNVEGIAEVDDRMEVENKEPEAVFHTVETGDTLSKISKEHYGDANKYNEIFEANKPMLKHPDKIYPGQVLRIPARK